MTPDRREGAEPHASESEVRRGILPPARGPAIGTPDARGEAGVTQAEAMTQHRPLVRAFVLRHVGDVALDPDGNIYFTHHYIDESGATIETDIYVCYRR